MPTWWVRVSSSALTYKTIRVHSQQITCFGCKLKCTWPLIMKYTWWLFVFGMKKYWVHFQRKGNHSSSKHIGNKTFTSTQGKESLLFLSWYALLMFLYFFFLSFQTAQSLCFKILQFFTIYSLHLISMFFYSYVLYFLLQTSPL